MEYKGLLTQVIGLFVHTCSSHRLCSAFYRYSVICGQFVQSLSFVMVDSVFLSSLKFVELVNELIVLGFIADYVL